MPEPALVSKTNTARYLKFIWWWWNNFGFNEPIPSARGIEGNRYYHQFIREEQSRKLQTKEPAPAGTTVTGPAPGKEDEEPKKYYGFSLDEWSQGIPQFLAGQEESQYRRSRDEESRLRSNAEMEFQRQQRGIQNILAMQQQNNVGWLQNASEGWEIGRQEAMGRMTGPRNWISRWQMENQPNPFRQQLDMILQSSQGQLQREFLANQQWAGTELMEKFPGVYEGRTSAPNTYAEYLTRIAGGFPEKFQAAQAEQQAEAARAAPRATATGVFEVGEEVPTVRKPQAPTTPEWMRQFVPGLGGELTKEVVAPPSAQQWTRTPWSQREGLAGYMDWTGQEYRDMLEQMAMMLPENPRRARNWLPARQKTAIA